MRQLAADEPLTSTKPWRSAIVSGLEQSPFASQRRSVLSPTSAKYNVVPSRMIAVGIASLVAIGVASLVSTP